MIEPTYDQLFDQCTGRAVDNLGSLRGCGVARALEAAAQAGILPKAASQLAVLRPDLERHVQEALAEMKVGAV